MAFADLWCLDVGVENCGFRLRASGSLSSGILGHVGFGLWG